MYRTKIGARTVTDTTAAVEHLLERMAQACAVCDDLACLDCAAAIDHTSCTRACPACSSPAESAVDWDQAWEASSIITELRGLERVDQAVRAL